jgi:hypothetical protein
MDCQTSQRNTFITHLVLNIVKKKNPIFITAI